MNKIKEFGATCCVVLVEAGIKKEEKRREWENLGKSYANRADLNDLLDNWTGHLTSM